MHLILTYYSETTNSGSLGEQRLSNETKEYLKRRECNTKDTDLG